MRKLALTTALMVACGSVLPLAQAQAQERPHHRHRMTVELANGKTVTFQMVRMHGQMMAVIPFSYLSDAVKN